MKAIRGGAGLGDSIYMAAVVRHLVATGRGDLEVCSNYPEVFSQLPVKVSPFRKARIDVLAHYSARKNQPTTQWQDICFTAGLREPVALKLDWQVREAGALIASLRAQASGRPMVLVQLPRAPMGRTDGFGMELLPDCRVIQRSIEVLGGRALLVQIGSGRPLFEFKGVDVDLRGITSVAQLLDLATAADAFLGYVSFIVPLAEVFDKRALLVWSRRGLRSGVNYVRQITPAKVLHKASSRYVLDDCKADELEAAVEALL